MQVLSLVTINLRALDNKENYEHVCPPLHPPIKKKQEKIKKQDFTVLLKLGKV